MKNDLNHPSLGMTKEEFIEWTTEGFPIFLENPGDFMVLFADYVNKAENIFNAYLDQEQEKVYLTIDKNVILTVAYEKQNKKVLMLTAINETNADSGYVGEFPTDLNEYELKKFLGEACLGVIVFCQGIEQVREENELAKISEKISSIMNDASKAKIPNEKIFSDNKKYDKVWPLN